MHITDQTKYFEATDAQLEEVKWDAQLDDVKHPVVLAIRDDEIIGYLGTNRTQEAIVAGPLKASSAIVAMRLIEAYNTIMKGYNVQEYWFSANHKNPKWAEAIQKLGLKPFAEKDGDLWFKWRVN